MPALNSLSHGSSRFTGAHILASMEEPTIKTRRPVHLLLLGLAAIILSVLIGTWLEGRHKTLPSLDSAETRQTSNQPDVTLHVATKSMAGISASATAPLTVAAAKEPQRVQLAQPPNRAKQVRTNSAIKGSAALAAKQIPPSRQHLKEGKSSAHDVPKPEDHDVTILAALINGNKDVSAEPTSHKKTRD